MNDNPAVIIRSPHGQWRVFDGLKRVVCTTRIDDVQPALTEVERAVDGGLFAAGFLAYEAAPAFDQALDVRDGGAMPLLWFGLFESVKHRATLPDAAGSFSMGDWSPSVSRDAYADAIRRIKRYIHQGDTYQVNYTLRLCAPFAGDPYAFFHTLCRAQKTEHCAFIATEHWAVCSASPELFFSLRGHEVVSRPMKGTAPRGLTCDEDAAHALALRASFKNRAENVMIVDMVRNDLGRVATPGSVRATRLYHIERYPTVLQMTSTVKATTAASFSEIMRALFPCASITGAPKVRTMQIIRELETAPRGVYTGAIGYLLPGREASFSVAIRTVVVDRKAGLAEYGVGGGVVWDSQGADEYAECLLKARVLTEAAPPFDLIETMLWTPADGYFLLDRHLRRLGDSARYFGFRFSPRRTAAKLMRVSASLSPVEHRIRLLLGESGGVSIETAPLSQFPIETPLRVGVAATPAPSSDRFLYHKTTHRAVYDAARAERPDCDDVILFNERGEVTEATIANVAAKIGGVWVTPPVAAGLLAGTFRAYLLDRHEIEERTLRVDDLKTAEAIALLNSVRRWMPAQLSFAVARSRQTADECAWLRD